MYSRLMEFISAVLVFAAMDAVWLGGIAGSFYESHIGPDNALDYDESVGFGFEQQWVIWIRWGALVMTYLLLGLAVVQLALPAAQLNHGGLYGRADDAKTSRQRMAYCKRRERQEKANFWSGVKVGALVYGIYNFTNLSFLAEWDCSVTLVDTAYGCVVFGVATMAAAAVGSAFDCLGSCRHEVIRDEIKIVETEIERDDFVDDSDEVVVEEHIIEEIDNTPEPRHQLVETEETVLVDTSNGNTTTIAPTVTEEEVYYEPAISTTTSATMNNNNGYAPGVITNNTGTGMNEIVVDENGLEVMIPENQIYRSMGTRNASRNSNSANYGKRAVSGQNPRARIVRRQIKPSTQPITHKRNNPPVVRHVVRNTSSAAPTAVVRRFITKKR